LKRIIIDETICSGCRACEIACVVQKEGKFGTALARIRIEKNDVDGLDQPHVCQICEGLPCVKSCPTGALQWDEVIGRVILFPEECIHCDLCVEVCPFEAIWIHPGNKLPLLCDLCDGDPACVKRCATGAIIFVDKSCSTFKAR